MVDAPAHQDLPVEEVAEGPVADVVEKAGQSQCLLDTGRRRRVREGGAQRLVDAPREEAGEVHGAEQVHEPRVLRRREHPPRRLQLVDAAQPLQPRGVEQRPLAWLVAAALGDLDVAVQRVRDQVDLAEAVRGRQRLVSHRPWAAVGFRRGVLVTRPLYATGLRTQEGARPRGR